MWDLNVMSERVPFWVNKAIGHCKVLATLEPK
jgi:hypothetical protein